MADFQEIARLDFRLSASLLSTDDRGYTFRPPVLRAGRGLEDQPYLFFSSNPSNRTLRGFHLQVSPYEETKLITCMSGAIFVAVFNPEANFTDGTRTATFTLEAKNGYSLLVGRGVATAWITLENNTNVLYQISGKHNPDASRGYRFDDPYIGVKWPFEPEVISDRDMMWDFLSP